MITPTNSGGPKQNFLSLTVCTLEHYLKNGSENTFLLPYTPVLKWDQHCRLLFAVKTATQCSNQRENLDLHDRYRNRPLIMGKLGALKNRKIVSPKLLCTPPQTG